MRYRISARSRKVGVENYYHEPSLYARCTSSGRKLGKMLPQLLRPLVFILTEK